MDLRKIRAVLFDLDGTLLDTVGDICACLNITMRRFGYPELTTEACRKLICPGIRLLVKGALPADTSEERLDEVISVYQSLYSVRCADLTEPYPGAVELLQRLEANGYQVGMITNKIQADSEYLMKVKFPDTHFALLWGNDDVRPLKPSPESGKLACEALGRKPDEILFVGDGDTDINFAVNNGFIACGVTWGYRDPAVLKLLGADMMIDSLGELGRTLGLPPV